MTTLTLTKRNCGRFFSDDGIIGFNAIYSSLSTKYGTYQLKSNSMGFFGFITPRGSNDEYYVEVTLLEDGLGAVMTWQ